MLIPHTLLLFLINFEREFFVCLVRSKRQVWPAVFRSVHQINNATEIILAFVAFSYFIGSMALPFPLSTKPQLTPALISRSLHLIAHNYLNLCREGIRFVFLHDVLWFLSECYNQFFELYFRHKNLASRRVEPMDYFSQQNKS